MDKTTTVKKGARQKNEKSFFVSVFLGTVISLVIGLILLVVTCFLGLSMKDPDKYTPMLSLASLFITALISGYLAARTHRKSGLACGALSGILLVGILVLLAFAFGYGIHISLFAICAPAVIVCSTLSGVVGVGADVQPKKKHKIKF